MSILLIVLTIGAVAGLLAAVVMWFLEQRQPDRLRIAASAGVRVGSLIIVVAALVTLAVLGLAALPPDISSAVLLVAAVGLIVLCLMLASGSYWWRAASFAGAVSLSLGLVAASLIGGGR